MHNDFFYKLKRKLLRLQTNLLKAEIVGSVFKKQSDESPEGEKERERDLESCADDSRPTDTDTIHLCCCPPIKLIADLD